MPTLGDSDAEAYNAFSARWDDPQEGPLLKKFIDRFDGQGVVLKTHNQEDTPQLHLGVHQLRHASFRWWATNHRHELIPTVRYQVVWPQHATAQHLQAPEDTNEGWL